MFVSVALALACAGLAAVCILLNSRVNQTGQQETGIGDAERELYELRADNTRRRREVAALLRELQEEQERSDAFEDAYVRQKRFSDQLKLRVEQADSRRIESEKEVFAGRMRIQLLEEQVSTLEREQVAQEQLYQDILREREETLARLQDQQQKKRPRKKNEVSEEQITFDDLFTTL